MIRNEFHGNPVIRHFYTADPTVLVVDDTLYLYTGHDEAPPGVDQYIMHNWLAFSTQDMIRWEDHSLLLNATDFAWAKGDAYASKVIRSGNQFYWYVAVSHATIPGKAIGVATAESPLGPFVDARGSALVTHDMLPAPGNEKANLDPTVIVDRDGEAYMFWGNGQCYFVKLNKNRVELDGEIQTIELPDFQEGAHIHERNGWYYLCYGYQIPEKVAYAMSRSIMGPWEFKGVINEVPFRCETNRPAIVEFKGRDYFFYHNGALPDGNSHHRSVCVDFLHYNDDGTIRPVVMTEMGVHSLSNTLVSQPRNS
nr:glycoside hydrolase family 43 protein [uncultured Dyadobacter sp.]